MLILQGDAVDPEVAVAGGVTLRLQLSDSIRPGGTNALMRVPAILLSAEVAWDKQRIAARSRAGCRMQQLLAAGSRSSSTPWFRKP